MISQDYFDIEFYKFHGIVSKWKTGEYIIKFNFINDREPINFVADIENDDITNINIKN